MRISKLKYWWIILKIKLGILKTIPIDDRIWIFDFEPKIGYIIWDDCIYQYSNDRMMKIDEPNIRNGMERTFNVEEKK